MTNIITHLTSGGRVVIPAAVRKALGIKDGDEVIISLDETSGEVRIATRRQRLRRAQALVTSRIARDRSLSDELIGERRNEAEHD